MLRRSVARRCAAAPPPPPPSSSSPSSEADTLLQQLRHRRKTRLPRWLRAHALSRWQVLLMGGSVLCGGVVALAPLLRRERHEARHGSFVPVDATALPYTSPQWWDNEWRKGNTHWRSDESQADFHVPSYTFVKAHTGRDLSSAALFRATHPGVSSRNSSDDDNRKQGNTTSTLRRVASLVPLVSVLYTWRRRRGDDGNDAAAAAATTHSDATPPRALVPLCGDSPILRTLVLQGYEVDGVDVSETAMRAAVERTERALPLSLYDRIHLHLSDFFAPELWQGALRDRRYDVIYDHKALVALPPERRYDYAALLKRALKDDGVMYVGAIYRTGRVKGNTQHGPPFALTRQQLAALYPEHEGFFVRCEHKTDAMLQLSREDKLLQRVPKSMYATPYHCVVFREASVNLATRQCPLGETTTTTTTTTTTPPPSV